MSDEERQKLEAEVQLLMDGLPLDLSDPKAVARLVKVAWDAVTEIENLMHEHPNDGRIFLLHDRLKTAVKAVVRQKDET